MVADLRWAGRLKRTQPQGPPPGADPTPTSLAYVHAVDVPGKRVQVRVRDAAVWVPALAAQYVVGGQAVVLWDVVAGRPAYVIGTQGPAEPAPLATVTAVAGTTVTVTWNGAATPLPAIPGTYTVGQTARVLTDAWGLPYLALGPSSVAAAGPSPESPSEPSTAPRTVKATVTLAATWSGSWRASGTVGWNTWNVGRYGWPATMWQGNGRGSGPMTGLATWGNLVTNLGATEILVARLNARRNDGEYGARTLTVQGSPHGSRPAGAPTGSGGTFSDASDGSDGWSHIGLDSTTCEGLRTGAVRGFRTAGGDYSGWTDASLTLTFLRPA
ncbi:hypothetical protein [Antribacter gilvus]|uniref:hypothetical protein n=1 Tax=Antribacter gilvus TaxID=2304675 RepID=UPI000F769494|nr:hypothetical protein [Antribacter gilvus]